MLKLVVACAFVEVGELAAAGVDFVEVASYVAAHVAREGVKIDHGGLRKVVGGVARWRFAVHGASGSLVGNNARTTP